MAGFMPVTPLRETTHFPLAPSSSGPRSIPLPKKSNRLRALTRLRSYRKKREETRRYNWMGCCWSPRLWVGQASLHTEPLLGGKKKEVTFVVGLKMDATCLQPQTVKPSQSCRLQHFERSHNNAPGAYFKPRPRYLKYAPGQR